MTTARAIKAMMATKRAGRGLAPYAVLADEIDFYQYPAEQMATIEATAARIYAVTTGNGPDGRAPEMWRRAQAGEGRYHGVFFPWHLHPDREDEWYLRNVTEAAEPRLAHREFAATPEEAFAAPEGVFFERWMPRSTPRGRSAPSTTGRPGGRSTSAFTGRPACGFSSARRARPSWSPSWRGASPLTGPPSEFADKILDDRRQRWACSSRRAAPSATRPARPCRARPARSEFEVFRLEGPGAHRASPRRSATAACASSTRSQTPTCRCWSPRPAPG